MTQVKKFITFELIKFKTDTAELSGRKVLLKPCKERKDIQYSLIIFRKFNGKSRQILTLTFSCRSGFHIFYGWE